MCESHPSHGLSRRQLLGRAAVAAGAVVGAQALGGGVTAAVPPVEVMPGLSIYPRAAWGGDLLPKGAIAPETPQVLLVHHTASSNSYTNTVNLLRSTYAYQTRRNRSDTDGMAPWPDVCYHFFVGRGGDVWEGRWGSLGGPVVGDSTGGNQGFSQLVCLLGDFTSAQPTAAARAALVKVLAWMAGRYDIDVAPGATTSFVSRGSQRFKKGTLVTSSTVAGHRDMSYTACPGNSFYPELGSLRTAVAAQREVWRTALWPARRLGRVQL